MTLTIGKRFVLEIVPGRFYFRIPYIGAACVCPGMGLYVWDSWRALRQAGEV